MTRAIPCALVPWFNTPKRNAMKPRYEIKGHDGRWRALERDGRKFRAELEPGTTGEWDSLRDARAGHAVRRAGAA